MPQKKIAATSPALWRETLTRFSEGMQSNVKKNILALLLELRPEHQSPILIL